MRNRHEFSKIKLWCFIILSTLVLAFTAKDLHAQKMKRKVLTAAYLYQLSQNIHWPNAGTIKQYRFHIIDADKRVYNELKKFSSKAQLHGKPIAVSYSSSEDAPDNVHIVYVGQKKADLFESIHDKFEKRSVLLVSTAQENKRIIMINLFETTEKQLRFEINKANILNQSLGIEPDIILLGGTEIDVAKLFRESQITLEEQEQLIRQQKKTALEGKARIDELAIKAQEQQRIIEQQDQAVLEQQARLKEVVRKTIAQEKIIAEQKLRVQKEQGRYADLARETEEQQRTIRQQEKAVLEQQARLKKAIEKTKQQEQAIAVQNKRVEQEQKRYADLARESEEQQKLIAQQQKKVLTEEARFRELSSKVQEQQRIIKQQNEAVLAERVKLDKAVTKTLEQDRIIAEQKKRVKEEQKRYSDLARESKEQQAILDRQKAIAEQERKKYEQLTESVRQQEVSLQEQAKKIEAREAVLEDQDIKIETQETIINKQTDVLASQSDIIASQRNFLYALGAAVLLLCGLAYAIYRGYRAKQITNALLAEQKQLLEQNAFQLAEANDKLKDLDRLKSMFIASMSHELRTPLNSIIGFTGIILSERAGKLEPKQRDFLSRSYKSSKHLLALISDVIDISKIESGKVEAYPEQFSLNEVLAEVLDCASSHRKEDVELKTTIPAGIEMYSDRKRVLQCILNLLSNALKYTEKRSVHLSVTEIDGQIEIKVEDTGIGISEADMENLFQPFERFHTPLRISEAGTGLGLYLTRKLTTEVLAGSLHAESSLGKGSTFYLTLPKTLK